MGNNTKYEMKWKKETYKEKEWKTKNVKQMTEARGDLKQGNPQPGRGLCDLPPTRTQGETNQSPFAEEVPVSRESLVHQQHSDSDVQNFVTTLGSL
jgi:hypothetical protein